MKQTWWKRYEPRWVRLAPRTASRYPLSHVTVLDAKGDALRRVIEAGLCRG
jgi:hypothetical protein